ncbi:arabinose ABC transporter permease [Brachybacterium endophyticum]|uniref:Arabinose ABC transporter permease n=1 Tax=Brachybacterium endophyticum TaxID=2182385 RepID=A0A2U2RGX5_9MICO|nr:MFS transporter [Brachybacterium endophyticum]PWH05098.1 arabinose ABC transporter permease [Brachybacterium endophyticum]
MTGGRQWMATIALAVGIFILITIEELPIGVLSVMAPDLGVSAGVGGLAVTVPGVLAGVIGMLAPVLVRGLDRRLVLVLALGSVVLSCALSVVAPNFAVLLLARLFAGTSIGLYWSVLAVVAVAQVPASRASRALTVAFSGAGAALVLGVPVASWIGTHLGWRSAFAVVGLAALVAGLLILLLVAPVRTEAPVTVRMMRRAGRSRGVRHALVLTGLVITAQFITYGYVSPLLHARADVPFTRIGAMLLLFGLAGIVGNFAVGIVLRRSAPLGVLVIAAGLGAALLAFLLIARTPGTALLVMPLWGLFAGAASVTVQAFVSSEARDVVEEGTAMNSAVFNISIAFGALIGGRILDHAGQTPLVLTSVTMIVVAIVILVRYIRTTPTHV